jgi:integrase
MPEPPSTAQPDAKARRDGGTRDHALPVHLATTGQVGASTQTQALSALLFLYREVLRLRVVGLHEVVRAKPSLRMPLVLSKAEVAAVLRNLHGTPWLMASLLYGAGLRLLECVRLRVKDIDLARGEIAVRDGKGRKDRTTLLPAALAAPLSSHLANRRRQHELDLTRPFSRGRSRTQFAQRASLSRQPATPCATALRPTSSNRAATSARSRSC